MINNDPPPTWVVVTGTIRDEVFLLKRFAFFSDLKKSGYINQIVFSTWKGEVEKFTNIATALRNYGIVLVESVEPDVGCRGHYLHQVVSLGNALEVCPDGSFVFRTRTDKCGLESGFVEENIAAFLRARNYVRSCEDDLGVMNYKIGTFGEYFTEISNKNPLLFFWNDRAYFGLKQDLQKLLNYNVLAYDFQKLTPEQALFASHFMHWWPCLSYFYQGVNQYGVQENIHVKNDIAQEKIDALTEFLVLNRLFRHAFLTERYVLHKYFFDIPSGLNFEFSTKYRGIEIRTHENEVRMLTSLREMNSSGFSDDMDALSKYLEEHFAISPVRKKVAETGDGRYSFLTPQSTLSIINQA